MTTIDQPAAPAPRDDAPAPREAASAPRDAATPASPEDACEGSPTRGLGDEPHADDIYARTMRHDGWTPARQRRFLEFVADGYIVDHAAQMVGLSTASAYAFRRRPAGAAFALGWRAANLVARDHLADTMLDRARHGTTETITRPDGSTVERHRLSDRLGLQMLARLDRQAEAATAGEATAARLVAGDFDPYLDLVGADAGPARAGLFLATHGDAATDLADLAALARADRARRAAPAGEVADLDPADRHGWTAEQWARAEAAGIVALAPAPLPVPEGQLPQLRTPADAADTAADDAAAPRADAGVWWCSDAEDYRTDFPPPDDFLGDEDGLWGDHDYARALSPEEQAILGLAAPDPAEALAAAITARDAWFAAYAAEGDPDETPAPQPAAPADAAASPQRVPCARHHDETPDCAGAIAEAAG